MSPDAWEHITERLGEILDRPDREAAILGAEPPPIRRSLETLLAAHRAAAPEGPIRRFIAGRYELLKLLGAGGSGEAWLSLDSETGRQVVVKIPLHWEWYREDVSRRFLAEAEATRRLNHPGVVTTLDTGFAADGAPFLVMPYVEGISLRERLARGLIEPAGVASLIEQIGSALLAAHREQVVHRDIKPENIMLQEARGGPRAILIDFGIALLSDLGHSAGTTTRFFGTTRYMAPEQLLGKPEKASDVYALALVTYEALTAKPLFASENPVGLFEEQRGFRESALQGVPYSVRHALAGALRFHPEKRPDVETFARTTAAAIRKWGGLWRPSRRLILASAGGLSPLAAWLAYENRPLTAAERTVHYKAGQTFADVGWAKIGTVDVDVTVFDEKDPSNRTILGNRLASSDQGAFHTTLPERVQSAGLRRPWRLTGNVIPLHGNCNFGVGFREAGIRFVMGVTRPDGGGSFAIAPLTYSPKLSDMRQSTPLSSDRMVELKMTFDPAAATASIAVDGRTLIPAYPGCREYVGRGVGLGFSVQESKIAEGVFGDVSFEMD